MQPSPIPPFVQTGCRAYGLLLLFYPSPLRSRFQQEMLAVFEDQICEAWKKSGYKGVLQSWWRAIAELLCIAFPARLDSLKIPILSIILSVFLTAFFFAKVVPPNHCPK